VEFNTTDLCPWQGIPRFRHLYTDDNPSGTDGDVYNLVIRVRDDDMAVGEYVTTFDIRNVWPVLDKDGLAADLISYENELYTPEMKFFDPGTGPTETWSYWLDVDNSESLTPDDVTGPITTTTVVNDATYGIIPPLKIPFNDDYEGNIRFAIYDDDVETANKYMNATLKLRGEEGIYHIEDRSYSSGTQYNNAKNMVVDQAGNLYSIYVDYPYRYQIYVEVSSDIGKTWSQYKVSTDSASSSQPQPTQRHQVNHSTIQQLP
jgi:hypothetical protein